MDNFTIKLRQAIEKSGLSGAELCEKIKIHPPTLSKYLHGTSGMNLQTFYSICIALNVSADWLLDLDNTSQSEEKPI